MSLLDELAGRLGPSAAPMAPAAAPPEAVYGNLIEALGATSPNPPLPLEAPRSVKVRDAVKDFTGNFLFALGQSLKASASAPGGRGTRAGMGAALEAPLVLQQMRDEAERQQQADELKRAQFLSTLQQQGIQNALAQRTAETAQGNLQVNRQRALTEAERAKIEAARVNQPKAATDDIQEYNFYAEQEKAAGRTPKTLLEYKQSLQAPRAENLSLEEKTANQWLANNPGKDLVDYAAFKSEERKRENASRAQVEGLAPQQLTRVNTLAAQFDTNPVVKNYNETLNRFETVKSILGAKLGGPGDLALVYEFMKGLDPTSVVRESEYETAAKSGNIFAGAFARFNGYLKPEGGFLPEQVRQAFFQILDKKLASSKKQVKAMHQDFGRRIDKITGNRDGASWLTDYSEIFDQGDTTNGGPKIGTIEDGYEYLGGDPANPASWRKR